MSNSLQAVRETGAVTVRAVLSSTALELEVADDGVGMDEETQTRVFEPFYSARRDGSGTGLGMSIVRQAVSALGGEISVESKVGKGTIVRLVFGKLGENGGSTGHGSGRNLEQPE